ncbi:Major facilitator sugar transporter-like [Trinorchestia longiramus]|nr:Major facilitator sugar transporter-like [Trinorchestia longiramus]
MATTTEDTLFESVLQSVGSSGRYQVLLLWVFLAPLNFLISWVALSPVLLVESPDHWCRLNGRPNDIDPLTWRKLTIPRTDDGSFSQCTQYNVSESEIDTWILNPDFTRNVIPCQAGYEYSQEDFEKTLATRLDWVCVDSGNVAMWQSIGIAGNVVGTLMLNPLSDKIGRRAVFVLSATIHGVMGIVRVFVQPLWLVMFSQFLANTSFPPMLEISLILVYELVSSKWRSRVTAISYMFWSAGTCTLALIAWLSRTDQLLSIIINLPFLLYIPAAYFIPESPRWLLTKGRVDEAFTLLSRLAAVNGRPIPPTLKQEVSDISKRRQPTSGTVFQLLKTPVLRRRTILLTWCYVLNNLFFYGLIYNTANMNGNVFINFFLNGLSEIPANTTGWWASLNLGRRFSQSVCFLLAATFSGFTIFTENAPTWVSISLLTTSKFFITISFLVVYLMMGELYPTSHCGRGVGFASLFASIAGTTAPYIADSSRKWYGSPFVILMILGLSGSVLSSFLPETLNAPIPQNLKEAESHLGNTKYFSYDGRRFCDCASPRSSTPPTAELQKNGAAVHAPSDGSIAHDNPAFEAF